MFFFHYDTKKQFGGSKRSTLPINILKHGSIAYFQLILPNINNFYDFFKSDVVDDFLQSVYESCHPQKIRFKHSLKLLTSKEVK